jgi:hypothetical protein
MESRSADICPQGMYLYPSLLVLASLGLGIERFEETSLHKSSSTFPAILTHFSLDYADIV